MKDTVEVIINADGKTCTTVNPLGAHPPRNQKGYPYKWAHAESERKTYEIQNIESRFGQTYLVSTCFGSKMIIPGTTHQAQIINNKAVIL